ncbi:hypothetical protein L9F63_013976, partial [Diploptera punctata]
PVLLAIFKRLLFSKHETNPILNYESCTKDERWLMGTNSGRLGCSSRKSTLLRVPTKFSDR